MGFSTDAIHAGQSPDPTTGAVMTPIYMTSTYAQPEFGSNKGYTYGRTNNLNRDALEQNIASLEKGKYGIAFSSGVAAIHSLMGLLKPGDHVIASKNIYGGTYRVFENFMKNFGIEFSWVDMSVIANIESAVRENTKLVFMETPSNPLLILIDLRAGAEICRGHNLISIVDNTFMTPYFQRPIELGADIVIHSSTKYLNGHSDVIGGIVVTNNKEYSKKIKFMQRSIGAIPSPFDCWLTLRATKTLAVRMEQHNKNAIAVAEFLKDQSYVKKIYYPGLSEHPQHDLAKEQMSGFGGIVTADFGDINIAKKLFKNTKIFELAESLGGVESLLNHSATMTHASVPKDERAQMGITDSLVRISVGIEDVADLINDIDSAIRK
ncbi:Cystathionine gamma-lyase [hydrothermal vent metagenome]|uniref:Cystathionine gamma-lyase n=1 Tax=hydrothermal vent metagenome TaxID=652676 RepID=A0A3B1CQZ9_9ZZZZ